MWRRLIIILTILAIGIFVINQSVYAQQSEADIEKQIKEYQEKLDSVRRQKTSLANELEKINTQISIAELTIQRTEVKITEMLKQIETLSSRIDNLDKALNSLSSSLIVRIVNGYKTQRGSILDLLLDSGSFSDLAQRVTYQKRAQQNNEKLLMQVQDAKSTYEEQKATREQKKIELDRLTTTLRQQQEDQRQQQAQKQKLLADTQNDELVYQRLLTQAQQQLGSFRSFVQSSGGDSIISANAFGNGSDGAYYSQRDARWANQSIGYSSESILDVGCLLSSIAMFGKKNGADVTPANIAADVSRFWATTAWMRYPWPGIAGKSYTSIGISGIDGELASGNYVIVGVMINNCAYGGNHFVVLTRKDGNDYIMHDPIYGPDKKFSSYYGTICTAATFK